MFLFFFFKQKTAYEMRISDWSSDVCSSDLFAGAVVGHFLGPLYRVDAGGLASAVSKDFPSGGLVGSRYTTCIDGYHDALRAVVIGGIAHQFGIGHGSAVHGHFVGARVQQALHVGYLARSEENTSELQSLMRNSYDVSC